MWIDVNWAYLRKPALIFRSCTSFDVCARFCSSQYPLRLSDKDQRNLGQGAGFGIASDATLVAYGLRNRPCNRQLTQLEGNLSNFIDAVIKSLWVLVWIRWNRLRLNWSLTRLQAGWSLESTRTCLCYCQPQLGVLPKPSCFYNVSLSNPYDFSFLGVATRLWLIGLWNPHEIISVTVNLNSIIISRHFADAISALKSVWYLARRLHVVTRPKVVIHEIPYAKRIRNCKSDNSVQAYARVWPRMKVHQ